MYSGMKKDVERLIEIFKNEPGAIQYGNFVFASGLKSNNKIDAEFVLKNEEGAKIIGKLAGSKILDLEKRNKKKYEIAGVANGGAKVAELAAGVLGREYVSMDPHDGGGIVGEIYEGMDCIICEDVTTTGSSIRKCYEKFILPRKAFAKHAIAVVDRNEGAVEILGKLGIKHEYFITKKQLGVHEDSF